MIRLAALALYVPALFITYLLWTMVGGMVAYIYGVVIFFSLAFLGTQLWRFEPWTMVPGAVFWSVFLLCFLPAAIETGLQWVVLLMLLGLILVRGPFLTRNARLFFGAEPL